MSPIFSNFIFTAALIDLAFWHEYWIQFFKDLYTDGDFA